MNKHLYRLVWNRAIGTLQVASELAHGATGGNASGAGRITARLRPASFSVWLALGMVSYASLATAGQITTDPHAPGSQRPTVMGSAGAAPLVNITTPSAAGVSRNTFSQLDVDSSGVVLNNSRTGAQTQLAGAISGNPFLATGTATIILNEVTGPNPTQLGGYVEVGGDRAQVIIASPSGITCDGCGFLNASRVTLTTGTPQLTNGSLDGYRVTGGTVVINGKGLDASQTDYTDIIARAVQVNAGVWAPQLQVTIGANQVSADQSQVTRIAGMGTAPAFALDSSALGGMYANKIVLLATEQGVGVRNAGTLGASAGDVRVTTDGRLINAGAIQSQTGNTTITADGGVANSGTLSAASSAVIQTPADVDNSGGTINASRIAVDAAALRNAGGTITQTGMQGMALQAGTLLNGNGGTIGTPVVGSDPGTGGAPSGADSGSPATGGSDGKPGGSTPVTPPISPLAEGVLNIAGTLDNSGGTITAAAGFDLRSANGLNNDGGHLELRKLALTGGDLSNRGGALTIDGAASMQGGNLINDNGQLTFANGLALNVQNLSNRYGTLTQTGTDPGTWSVAGTLDNTDGTLASNAASLSLTAGTLINTGGTFNHAGTDGLAIHAGALQGAQGTIATAGAATISAGAIDHRGAMLSATQLTVNADSLTNTGGTIAASGDQANALTVNGLLDNGASGTIESNADLSLLAGTLNNTHGTIAQAGTGTLAINATTLTGTGGTIQSNGHLVLTGTTTDLTGATTSAQSIAITTGALTTAHGTLQALGSDPLALTVSGAFDNTGGEVATNGALQVKADSFANAHGTLMAAGTGASMVQVASTLDNTGGTLAAAGATTVHAGTLLNQGGTVQASGAPLTVSAAGLLDNSQHGVLASDGDLSINAATLDNTAGTVSHAGTGTLALHADTLHGHGGTIETNGHFALTGTTTDLTGGTTIAQSMAITTGALTTAGGTLQAIGADPLVIQATGPWDNAGGIVATNGALDVTAGALMNTHGTLTAAGEDASQLRVNGTFDNTSGVLGTAGVTTITADSLINQGGTIQAQSSSPLTVTVANALVNDQGQLQSNGAMTLTAGSLSNQVGTIQTPQGLTATVNGTLDDTGGSLLSDGDISLTAGTLINRNTTANQGIHGQALTLDVSSLDNSAGEIQASSGLTVTGGTLTNAGGVLDGQNTVTIIGTSLGNTGGQIIQRGDTGALAVNVSRALTNTGGGLIGAEGTANVQTASIDNSGGTTYAVHDLTLSANSGDVLNRNGGLLQTGGDLALTASGSVDNSAGQIDAAGAATITGASVTNTGGSLLAGSTLNPSAALTLTASDAIGNEGGTIGNRGGDVTVNAVSLDNSASGVLVAQHDLRLNLGGLNNAGGTTYATHDLAFQNANAVLDNTGGQFGAGNTATLTLAQLINDRGHIQADTLFIDPPSISNDGGTISAATAEIEAGSLTGIGTVQGTQSLDLHLTGDYANAVGNQIESDGTLGLTVDGTFTNQGTLQTSGTLNLSAGNIVNVNGGVINASASDGSGHASITAGNVDNQSGADLEGDTLAVTAGSMTNTGNISGDAVTITAGSLTNGSDLGQATDNNPYQSALIAAADRLSLYVSGTLINRDATLFSQGDLTIAADASGARSQAVINSSGDIAANGNIAISTQFLTNQRRVIQTSTVDLSAADQAVNSQSSTAPMYVYDDPLAAHQVPNITADQMVSADELAKAQSYCSAHNSGSLRCVFFQTGNHTGAPSNYQSTTTDTLTSVTTITAASAEGRIRADGDIALNGSVVNNASAIAAGRRLLINGEDGSAGGSNVGSDTVQNVGWVPTGTVQTVLNDQAQSQYLSGGSWTLGGWWTYDSTTTNQDILLQPGHVPGWLTYDAGQTLTASMTAGGAVSIAGNVTNTVVGATGAGGVIGTGALNDVQGLSLSQTASAQVAMAGSVGAAQGQTTAATGGTGRAQGQTVGTTDQPLPNLVPPSNAMYTQHGDPSAPFLVTTAPRFAKSAASSDYLLNALNTDPSLIHKRLGDGYYEQNLVESQILQLTGRTSLNGGDPMAQYTALMTEAAAEAGRLGLTLGAPLTSAQIASLQSDIVWLVNEVVDGQEVLVPVVYLSQATADRMQSDGALIAGDSVNIQSSGTVRNDGTLSGTQGVTIAADTLINTSALTGGDRLAIATRGDTINSGTLGAGAGGLQVVAGNDVVNTGTIRSAGDGVIVAGRDVVFDQGTLSAGKVAYVDAGRDAHFTAATVSGGTGVGVTAGRDLISDTVTDHQSAASYQSAGHTQTVTSTTDTVQRGSTFTSGGDISLQAGRDVDLTAANVQAGGVIGVAAGRDVNLNAATNSHTEVQDTSSKHGKTKTTTHSETESTDVVGTTLNGAQGIAIIAGQDINATAATLTSEGAVALHADRDINLLAGEATRDQAVDSTSKKKSFLSKKTTTTHDESHDTTTVGTTVSGGNISIAAGNDLTAQAAYLDADHALNVAAGHDINLTDAHDLHTETHASATSRSQVFSTSTLRFGSLDPGSRKSGASTTLSQSTSVGSTLSGDTVTVAAGHDVTGTNAQIVGTHDVVMAAGNNLTLAAGQNTYDETQGATHSQTGLMNGGGFSVLIGKSTQGQSTTVHDTSYSGSVVGSIDGGVTMTAGNTVHLTDATVLSNTGTAIIGKNVTIDAAIGSTDITQTQKQSSAGIHVGLTGGAATVLTTLAADGHGASHTSDTRLKALYVAQAAQTLFSPGAGNAMGLGKDADGAPQTGAGSLGQAAQGNTQGMSLRIGLGASSAKSTETTHDDTAYGSTIHSNGNVVIAATDGDLNVIGSQISGNNVGLMATQSINLLSQAEQHTDKSDSHNSSGEVGFSIGQTTGIYLTASAGQAQGHGNGTTHADTTVDAKDTLTLVSGGDTTIQGAQAKGNTVLADIGGNLNIASEQDTNDYANHSVQAGVTVVYGFSNTGVGFSGSLAASQMKSNYRSVSEISGIGAGDGGFNIHVNGHTDLKGGVIASAADAAKNVLDTGSLSYSDIQNQASYSSESLTLGGGMGTPGNSVGMGNGVSAGIGVPQHKSESSTTKAGIADGTITVRDNPSQDLSGLDRHATLDQAGLKPIFNAQKVQDNQIAGQLAGQVGMTAIGDLSNLMANHATTDEEKAAWSDGGTNKILLHGLVGAATAALGGGDAVGGAIGAGASEAASAKMQDYLDANHITDPAQRNVLMQLASVAIGAVGGGAGAATALQGDQYNRNLHETEVQKIKQIAQGYADQHPGMTVDQAEAQLTAQAQRDTDATFAQSHAGTDNDAEAYLRQNSSTFSDGAGNTMVMFTPGSTASYNNADMYANTWQKYPQEYANASAAAGNRNWDDVKSGLYADTASTIGNGTGKGLMNFVPDTINSILAAVQQIADPNATNLMQVPQYLSYSNEVEAGVAHDVQNVANTLLVYAGAAYTPARGAGMGSAADNIYTSTRPIGEVFPELQGINPYYVEGAGPGVNTNCVSCANAAQARLTGTDAQAVASPSKGYGTYSDLNASAPFGFDAPTSPSSVVSEMQQAGDGATRPVVIKQGGVDHVITVTNRGGQVYFLDTQMGQIITLRPDVPVRLGRPGL